MLGGIPLAKMKLRITSLLEVIKEPLLREKFCDEKVLRLTLPQMVQPFLRIPKSTTLRGNRCTQQFIRTNITTRLTKQ